MDDNSQMEGTMRQRQTWIVETLLVVIESRDPLHQLPLLTAAGVADEITGEDLLQLPHAQGLDVFRGADVRQGCSATRNHGLLCVRLERRAGFKITDHLDPGC